MLLKVGRSFQRPCGCSRPVSHPLKSPFYRPPDETLWSLASTQVGYTRKMELGTGH
jgi:hypothetical protein